MDLNQLIDNEIEQAIQSNFVQCIRQMNFEKDLIENSVGYAVACEKLFHMVKNVDFIKVEYCEHK